MTYEDKLHDKAVMLMEDLNEKYGWDNMISLDEYLYKYWDDLTQRDKDKINNLLTAFDDV